MKTYYQQLVRCMAVMSTTVTGLTLTGVPIIGSDSVQVLT